jgi:hypothetical protein
MYECEVFEGSTLGGIFSVTVVGRFRKNWATGERRAGDTILFRCPGTKVDELATF